MMGQVHRITEFDLFESDHWCELVNRILHRNQYQHWICCSPTEITHTMPS